MAALARFWNWLLTKLRLRRQFQISVPAAFIRCPCCKMDYTEALKAIPINASQATVVCSNNLCREQMEVYPDAKWGWLSPHVTPRARYN